MSRKGTYAEGCYGPGKRLSYGKVFAKPAPELDGEYVVKVGKREVFRTRNQADAYEWADWHNIRGATNKRAEVYWDANRKNKKDGQSEPRR